MDGVPLELETARLRIRPFSARDWQDVHAYTSDPQVRAYVPQWPETPEQAQTFVRANLGEDARVHALILRAGNRLIGHVAFHPWFARVPTRSGG